MCFLALFSALLLSSNKMDAMPLRPLCTCNVAYCLCFCNSIILHYRQNERGTNCRYTSRKACTLYIHLHIYEYSLYKLYMIVCEPIYSELCKSKSDS
jgi:hypothetical protein